jgi:hypothetical protein
MIPYRDESDLLSLMRLASSTAGGGRLMVYRIVKTHYDLIRRRDIVTVTKKGGPIHRAALFN